MGPVVDHLGGPHGGAALQIIDAQPLSAPGDMLRAHIVLAQGSHRALADLIVGDRRDELRVVAIIGQGHCHIGLAAAIVDVELVCLDELLKIGGGQPQHDLTNRNHFSHVCILSYLKTPTAISETFAYPTMPPAAFSSAPKRYAIENLFRLFL